ncbi:MAG: twin-arginine translocation signal domain-containing protein [Dehalococcoidia bacterium]|tara:strand:- start:89 stop:256 length:168 start_codon:yes stop_codon:yes gene_type:complete
MKDDFQSRRDFMKKSGVMIAIFAALSSMLKPGKYLFPSKIDSDSAFNPRDPRNKL